MFKIQEKNIRAELPKMNPFAEWTTTDTVMAILVTAAIIFGTTMVTQ